MKKAALAVLAFILAAMTVVAQEPASAKPDLSSVIGKTVVTCRSTPLKVPLRRSGSLDFWDDLPRTHFDPFMEAKIGAVEIHSADSLGYTVYAVLQLPNGKEGLIVGRLANDDANRKGDDLVFHLFLSQFAVQDLLRKLPAGLKDGDHIGLEVGMPVDAAVCLLGAPERRNDWGKGGKQLIYNGGRTVLYSRAGGSTVTDIQHF